jgi:valyl-tRNA synthetase
MAAIPQSYDPAKAEREWAERWERDGIYRWDPTRPRAETFAVDTPPLTVSGSLHIGHAFSFTQADVIVRYQRMTGRKRQPTFRTAQSPMSKVAGRLASLGGADHSTAALVAGR